MVLAEAVSGAWLLAWRRRARQAAAATGLDPAEVDWLLREVTDLGSLALRLESFGARTAIPLAWTAATLEQRWQQRLRQRVPLQHLLGRAPWRDFSLTVSPAVLVPRPETELLVDLAAEAACGRWSERGHWVDLGTGSGALALGLARALPQATVHAVDCSAAAIQIAQTNAWELGLQDRIRLYQGNGWEPLEAMRGQIAGMVANPPYIPSAQLPQLQPEVARHEPHQALDGGWDGLACIRYLVASAPAYLQPGGLWAIELMAGQAEAVTALLSQQGRYSDIRCQRDLAGIERFALARCHR